MSAIPAASVNLKTMADGTLRVSFDIEPAQAQDAFRLFAAPGTPVAIAALQVGYAAAKEPEPPKEPIGPLCKWLVMRCAEPEFWAFLNSHYVASHGFNVQSANDASEAVKKILDVKSRREVDSDMQSGWRFHELIRKPYEKSLVRRNF